MEKFQPIIDHTTFREEILLQQEQDGNRWWLVSVIDLELEDIPVTDFYDHFISICYRNHITFHPFVIREDEKTHYRVDFRQNGYDRYSISYYQKEKDISTDVARKLYRLLWWQLKNYYRETGMGLDSERKSA